MNWLPSCSPPVGERGRPGCPADQTGREDAGPHGYADWQERPSLRSCSAYPAPTGRCFRRWCVTEPGIVNMQDPATVDRADEAAVDIRDYFDDLADRRRAQ